MPPSRRRNSSKLLTDKRQGENRRVVLDPDVEASERRDIESDRRDRPGGLGRRE